jgi:hypothetical protein
VFSEIVTDTARARDRAGRRRPPTLATGSARKGVWPSTAIPGA